MNGFLNRARFWIASPAAAIFTALIPVLAEAAPPVPFYGANVMKVDKIGTESVVIKTNDSVDTVCAWYRKNLRDANGEKKTGDGAHLFFTHNGATVDVEPGNRFDPGTPIGLVWDSKKYGTYTAGK